MSVEFQESLKAAFQQYEEAKKNDEQAISWLAVNHKLLAQDVAQIVVSSIEAQEFAKDINRYFWICYICLREGTEKVLEKAIELSLLPSRFTGQQYKEALLLAKDRIRLSNLSEAVSKNLLSALDFFIEN